MLCFGKNDTFKDGTLGRDSSFETRPVADPSAVLADRLFLLENPKDADMQTSTAWC